MSPARDLETRLAETAMAALMPCDLGDGIEVVHDVETVELEMECDVAETVELDSTIELVRFSAPYERIELEIDAHAFRRATIEEARRLLHER